MDSNDPLMQRAADIRVRLHTDMRKTLRDHGQYGFIEGLLNSLVDDAMHQVEHLLTEIPRKEEQ
jgi:hypothetical protein